VTDPAAQLREHGVALLRDIFPRDALTQLNEAANGCFEAIETGTALPGHYQFNRFSHSLLLAALLDFGSAGFEGLVAPLSAPGLDQLFSEVMGGAWKCNREQSWARKKFPPPQTPGPRYHPQSWHQDGALGVTFPLQPGQAVPMTQLLTCWIPLNSCGRDSPGLEFVLSREEALLHFTELNDDSLRRRFPPDRFWAPVLEFGEGLVFLNGTLHRTFALPEMRRSRLSVEYRIFPR